jgi:hypothetical protein
MKRGDVLLAIFLIIILSAFAYTVIDKKILTTSRVTNQGSVSVDVPAYCGDGSCNNGETCSSCSADCGTCPTGGEAGGGGAGGGIVPAPLFTVDKELIKVVMRVGETLKVSLGINSTYSGNLNFELSTDMDEFIIFSQDSFTLDPKEQKQVFLTFFTSSKTEPGVYTGKIKVTGGGRTKVIPVILEVETKEVLFDVSLDIPVIYKKVNPGNFVVLQFTLFSLGKVGKVDVTVDYYIKDFEGNVIASYQDIINVEEQVSFTRTIRLPSDIKPGDYVAVAQVKYDYFVGTSSDIFEVVRKRGFIPYYLLLAGLLFLFVLIIRKLLKVVKEYRQERKIQT